MGAVREIELEINIYMYNSEDQIRSLRKHVSEMLYKTEQKDSRYHLWFSFFFFFAVLNKMAVAYFWAECCVIYAVVTIAVLPAVRSQAQTLDDSIRLYNDLLTGYEKAIRPALNQSLPLSVQFEFDLLSIREVDEIVGKLSIIGIVYLRWEDPRLSWNPFLYNGTYMINIPQEKVERWFIVFRYNCILHARALSKTYFG